MKLSDHTLFIFCSGFLGTDTFPYEAEVRVCGSKNNQYLCDLCGYITINVAGSWGTVMCPKTGLDGLEVTVQKPIGELLAICEIEIHGETVHF